MASTEFLNVVVLYFFFYTKIIIDIIDVFLRVKKEKQKKNAK